MFQIPVKLTDLMKADRVPPCLLSAVERIVFVSGVVHGASGLISTDFMGKSDPYCVVEGVSNSGDRVFIHRTRVIQDRLSPVWHEAFFYAVPQDVVVHKLNLSVYDSDEVEGVSTAATGEDDFLGRATVDVGYLINGARVYEDLPLIGAKAKKQDRVGLSGFRRNSAISVEVRVERRVQPLFQLHRQNADDFKPTEKHLLSRTPPLAASYVDVSQEERAHIHKARNARQVMELKAEERLATLAMTQSSKLKRSKWVQATDRRWPEYQAIELFEATMGKGPVEPADDDDFKAHAEKARTPAPAIDQILKFGALASYRRVFPSPVLPRPASLPSLHTKFNCTKTDAESARMFASTSGDSIPGFRDEAEKGTSYFLTGVRQRPALEYMTQH